MKTKYFLLLCFIVNQTTHCMHYIEHLFSATKYRTVKESNQTFQEVKFIYIDDNPDITHITLQIISAIKDSLVKGIILLVNCNGGSLTNFGMLHDTIKKASEFKPIISVVTRALSAGYIIASATDYIIAHRCSEVGSIGIIMEIRHFKNPLIKEDGIETTYTTTLFKGGEFKDIYHAYGRGELSEKEHEYLQKNVAVAYNTVVSIIAENRALNQDDAEEWANAKTFMANEALELGLIDQIGTLFDAEEKMLELIGIKGCSSYPDHKIKYSFCDDGDAF